MKKTEKIEVRVSADEKDRLARLSEGRGVTISELIRETMAGDIGMGSRDGKATRIVIFGALALYGLCLFWMGLAVFGDKSDTPPVMSEVAVSGETIFDTVLKTQVPHIDGFSQDYEFTVGQDAFAITQTIEETEDNIYLLKLDACLKTETGCEVFDKATIILSPPSENIQTGSANFVNQGREVFRVQVHSARRP